MAKQPFDWSEYFKLADELAKRTEESCRRSAMGRAYYYVYHLALARALANGLTVRPGEGTHTQMWRNFNSSPDPDTRKLGQIAQRLKEKRERADYNAHYARLEDEIPEMLADAQNFANKLSVLPARFPQSIT
jgi:uncharacterized protein (UPF0332 family)